MKMTCRRIGAFGMVMVLLGMMLIPQIPRAKADEMIQTESYVLNYNADDLDMEYAYTAPYLYGTPFMVYHSITTPSGAHYYDGDNHPEVFNLINTTKLTSGGEGTYASIPAYCTDASTEIRDGYHYRRINLEDSTYFSSGTAGKLRAVIMHAFPYQNVESIQDEANIWLQSKGLPELLNLQSGEAILAAQTAIWKLANGSHYEIVDNYSGRTNLSDGYLAKTVFTDTADQEESENTKQNIISLYDFYCNLDAMAPKYDAASESSLENPRYSSARNSDGTYTITVSVYVNTDVRDTDDMTITAVCSDQVKSKAIEETGEYSFTFENVQERTEVHLEINGYQGGGDVYLFDAEGNREASQTLVGYDSSVLPVHGEMKVTPNRVLNIFKSTNEEDGSVPLSNITFDIFYVASMEDIAQGKVTLSMQPTYDEASKYQTQERHVTSLTTDIQGFATFDFTENGYPDGVYLIVEQENPATVGIVDPFFVAIPGTTEDGSGFEYTINVNPKNIVETGPDIQKDVTKLDNNSDTFDVGDTHTWIIRGDVPAGIGNAQKYSISDILDYRLTYQKGSTEVRLFTRSGREIQLENGVHYEITEGTMSEGEFTVDCFQISLTEAGMNFVAQNLDSGDLAAEIRVYFDAVINENANMGSAIPNDAHIDYTNSAGVDYESDSDIPEVHTGGIHILKTDNEDAPLAGAMFKIARRATEAELENDAIVKETLTIGTDRIAVVFVDFHDTVDLSVDPVYETVTDKNGNAVIYGLAYGTYYLVETKAPAGYNLLNQPLEIVINEVSHLTKADGWENEQGEIVDNTLHVINTKFVLPDTGGIGTTVFTITGCFIIGAAIMLLLCNRKKRV